MAKPPSTWVIFTVGLTKEEEEHLNDIVESSGQTRNRFIRDLLAKQWSKMRKES